MTSASDAGTSTQATHGATRSRLLAATALIATAFGLSMYLTGSWASVENASVDLRFSVRGSTPAHNLLIVAVDSKTLNEIPHRWPFPRALDARAVDILHADGAKTIVYDVQFTQPTDEKDDLALFEAVSQARGVVLATTEIGAHGETEVLGGSANLRSAGAHAAAANFRANSSDVIQKYPYAVGGLKTLAVAAAEHTSGHTISAKDFKDGSAWIDFPGPAGTLPSVSFSDLLKGAVPPAEVAGKTVVIGATSPVLQDIHATSVTAGTGMSGPEVQADAIATALKGNPLREPSRFFALLAIVLLALVTPLCCLRTRPKWAFGCGTVLAGAYALGAQLAFDSGRILVLTYPLGAWVAGTLGALAVSYAAEIWEHQLAERYSETLEMAVRARTTELRATQRSVVRRLAQAAELRDEDTGLHVERVGRVCELLALQMGMPAAEAERLRLASALHDVGKIGIADSVLLKRGELDETEWELMKAHTRTGAALLAGSDSPLLQLAERIARTHHEKWDGSGYPEGLREQTIPLEGRICAVADVFDALSARRHYKESWPFEQVAREIKGKSGSHFDPAVVAAFTAIEEDLRREHALARATATAAEREPSAGAITAVH
jgi:CHASE2 domain-containing sensor protein